MRAFFRLFVPLVLLAVFFGLACPAEVRAEPNEYILRAGQSRHRIIFKDEYGGFIKNRYGVEYLDLKGKTYSFIYYLKKNVGVGIESGSYEGEFDYISLNEQLLTNRIKMDHFLFTLSYFSSPASEFTFGNGYNNLTRDFYGYKSSGITADNLDKDNTGSATDQSSSNAFLLQYVYRLLGDRGDDNTFGLELAFRYLLSIHQVTTGDNNRPALSEKGVPFSSSFDVSGLGFSFNFAISF